MRGISLIKKSWFISFYPYAVLSARVLNTHFCLFPFSFKQSSVVRAKPDEKIGKLLFAIWTNADDFYDSYTALDNLLPNRYIASTLAAIIGRFIGRCPAGGTFQSFCFSYSYHLDPPFGISIL
jgi:hypothetical protein